MQNARKMHEQGTRPNGRFLHVDHEGMQGNQHVLRTLVFKGVEASAFGAADEVVGISPALSCHVVNLWPDQLVPIARSNQPGSVSKQIKARPYASLECDTATFCHAVSSFAVAS